MTVIGNNNFPPNISNPRPNAGNGRELFLKAMAQARKTAPSAQPAPQAQIAQTQTNAQPKPQITPNIVKSIDNNEKNNTDFIKKGQILDIRI